jgi:CBS domain-containing protein
MSIATHSSGVIALEDATVADVMHPGVISCGPDATAKDLVRIMATQHVHCVMVIGLTGHSHHEHLSWGTVTDHDLMHLRDWGDMGRTAATLAREPIITVEPTMPVDDAATLMLNRGVSHVLVVDESSHHPVGVLSSLDIIVAMANANG